MLTLCVLSLAGCSENDSQVIELRQLRDKLALAEKKAAEAGAAVEAAQQAAQQAAATAASASSSSATQDMAAAAQKLTTAESRISSLEKELQDAKSAAQAATEAAAAAAKNTGASKGNADNFREFVKTMERDLLSKTSDLQQSVELALPTANIQETTVKRLRLPDELASSAFNSAVVFIIADAAGQQRRLEFPVQAGLDGQWRLPGSADVQKHIASVTAGAPTAPMAAAPQPAAAMTYAQQQPQAPAAPVQPAPQPPPAQPMAAAVPSSAPVGKQAGGPQTVVVQWDNNPRPQAQAQAAPAAPQPMAAPQQAAAPVQQPPPPRVPTVPTVPKSVMPVKQDVQIRFE